MSRPYKGMWEPLLREHRVVTEDKIIRIRSHMADLATGLEERARVLKARELADLWPYIPDIDFETLVHDKYSEVLELLQEKLQAIHDEYEEREIEAAQAKDRSGGIAA